MSTPTRAPSCTADRCAWPSTLAGDAVSLAMTGRVDRVLLASEPVEATGRALTLGPESFAIVALP